jgi:hypothetical protein
VEKTYYVKFLEIKGAPTGAMHYFPYLSNSIPENQGASQQASTSQLKDILGALTLKWKKVKKIDVRPCMWKKRIMSSFWKLKVLDPLNMGLLGALHLYLGKEALVRMSLGALH